MAKNFFTSLILNKYWGVYKSVFCIINDVCPFILKALIPFCVASDPTEKTFVMDVK